MLMQNPLDLRHHDSCPKRTPPSVSATTWPTHSKSGIGDEFGTNCEIRDADYDRANRTGSVASSESITYSAPIISQATG